MISWPDLLTDALARRRAVLVIGSGISKNSQGRDGKRPPTWREFLELALAALPAKGTSHIKRAIKGGEYLIACDWLKSRLQDRWAALLRSEFLDPAYVPSEFHKALYDLDLRVVLTPNFDKIYDGYASSASAGTTIIKTYDQRDISELIRASKPVILKYHGTIDAPHQLVFTRREYEEARVKHASFYRLLDALILTHTFLFVGCGVSDPDVQLLLGQYTFDQLEAPPHYIVLPSPLNDDLRTSLKSCYNLEALTYKIKGGEHAELLDSIRDLVQQVQVEQQKIALDQTW